LAESGTLVAVTSKNDPEVVAEALARADLLINRDKLFPVESGWRAKSESVADILDAWNIGADAVAFVDDSLMEVAEVQRRFPQMRCFVFPTKQDDKVLRLIGELRDLFGKDAVTEEDGLRLASLKAGASYRAESSSTTSPEGFLAELRAEIEASFIKLPFDRRSLELVNKTNQFNLNGRRVDEGEWCRSLALPESFLLTVSYTDKFGPLGKIGVAAGRLEEETLLVERWVLSCRAFSRRVEHASLKLLADRFKVSHVTFAFAPTGRNTPVRDFFASLGLDASNGPISITHTAMAAPSVPLYHKVTVNG
jgi:FkbH-like protein